MVLYTLTLSDKTSWMLVSCTLTAHRLASSHRTETTSLLLKKRLMMRDCRQRKCLIAACCLPSLQHAGSQCLLNIGGMSRLLYNFVEQYGMFLVLWAHLSTRKMCPASDVTASVDAIAFHVPNRRAARKVDCSSGLKTEWSSRHPAADWRRMRQALPCCGIAATYSLLEESARLPRNSKEFVMHPQELTSGGTYLKNKTIEEIAPKQGCAEELSVSSIISA